MKNIFQKNQILVGLILLALIIGCAAYFPKIQSNQVTNNTPLSDKIELSTNKDFLFSKNFHPNKVTLYGVGMGDNVNKIKTEDISEKNEMWIHTVNKIGYRPAEGKVVEMVLSHDAAKDFGIFREDEILIRFGKPDEVKEEKNALYSQKEYFYIDRGLIVRYMDKLGVSVNILSK